MSYSGTVGGSPGNIPVSHGGDLKVVDRKVKLVELILRAVICVLGLLAVVLVVTDTQVQEIFTVQKKAKFTDMKALVFLVVANGIAAGYSVIQMGRCGASMLKGSVVFSKPLAWLILSGDQLIAYMTLAALAAALQSAMIAKYSEPELQWMKLCDMYGKFCNQVGEGVASSIFVCLSSAIVSGISAFSLFRLYGANKGVKKSEG